MRGPPHHPTGVVCGTPPCISQIPLLLIPSQSRVPGFMVSQRNPTSCGVTNSPPPPHLRSHPSTSLHPRASGPGRPSPKGPFPSTLQVPKNPNPPPHSWGWGPLSQYTAVATIQVQSSCAIVSALSRSLGSPSALPCLPSPFPRPLHTPTSNSQSQKARGSPEPGARVFWRRWHSSLPLSEKQGGQDPPSCRPHTHCCGSVARGWGWGWG